MEMRGPHSHLLRPPYLVAQMSLECEKLDYDEHQSSGRLMKNKATRQQQQLTWERRQLQERQADRATSDDADSELNKKQNKGAVCGENKSFGAGVEQPARANQMFASNWRHCCHLSACADQVEADSCCEKEEWRRRRRQKRRHWRQVEPAAALAETGHLQLQRARSHRNGCNQEGAELEMDDKIELVGHFADVAGELEFRARASVAASSQTGRTMSHANLCCVPLSRPRHLSWHSIVATRTMASQEEEQEQGRATTSAGARQWQKNNANKKCTQQPQRQRVMIKIDEQAKMTQKSDGDFEDDDFYLAKLWLADDQQPGDSCTDASTQREVLHIPHRRRHLRKRWQPHLPISRGARATVQLAHDCTAQWGQSCRRHVTVRPLAAPPTASVLPDMQQANDSIQMHHWQISRHQPSKRALASSCMTITCCNCCSNERNIYLQDFHESTMLKLANRLVMVRAGLEEMLDFYIDSPASAAPIWLIRLFEQPGSDQRGEPVAEQLAMPVKRRCCRCCWRALPNSTACLPAKRPRGIDEQFPCIKQADQASAPRGARDRQNAAANAPLECEKLVNYANLGRKSPAQAGQIKAINCTANVVLVQMITTTKTTTRFGQIVPSSPPLAHEHLEPYQASVARIIPSQVTPYHCSANCFLPSTALRLAIAPLCACPHCSQQLQRTITATTTIPPPQPQSDSHTRPCEVGRANGQIHVVVQRSGQNSLPISSLLAPLVVAPRQTTFSGIMMMAKLMQSGHNDDDDDDCYCCANELNSSGAIVASTKEANDKLAATTSEMINYHNNCNANTGNANDNSNSIENNCSRDSEKKRAAQSAAPLINNNELELVSQRAQLLLILLLVAALHLLRDGLQIVLLLKSTARRPDDAPTLSRRAHSQRCRRTSPDPRHSQVHSSTTVNELQQRRRHNFDGADSHSMMPIALASKICSSVTCLEWKRNGRRKTIQARTTTRTSLLSARSLCALLLITSVVLVVAASGGSAQESAGGRRQVASLSLSSTEDSEPVKPKYAFWRSLIGPLYSSDAPLVPQTSSPASSSRPAEHHQHDSKTSWTDQLAAKLASWPDQRQAALFYIEQLARSLEGDSKLNGATGGGGRLAPYCPQVQVSLAELESGQHPLGTDSSHVQSIWQRVALDQLGSEDELLHQSLGHANGSPPKDTRQFAFKRQLANYLNGQQTSSSSNGQSAYLSLHSLATARAAKLALDNANLISRLLLIHDSGHSSAAGDGEDSNRNDDDKAHDDANNEAPASSASRQTFLGKLFGALTSQDSGARRDKRSAMAPSDKRQQQLVDATDTNAAIEPRDLVQLLSRLVTPKFLRYLLETKLDGLHGDSRQDRLTSEMIHSVGLIELDDVDAPTTAMDSIPVESPQFGPLDGRPKLASDRSLGGTSSRVSFAMLALPARSSSKQVRLINLLNWPSGASNETRPGDPAEDSEALLSDLSASWPRTPSFLAKWILAEHSGQLSKLRLRLARGSASQQAGAGNGFNQQKRAERRRPLRPNGTNYRYLDGTRKELNYQDGQGGGGEDDQLQLADGNWFSPYFDCSISKRWLLTYSVPFFARTAANQTVRLR